MSNKLSGKGISLNYRGTDAIQPPDVTHQKRDPSSRDTDYAIADIWINTETGREWYLARLSGGKATWNLVTLEGIEVIKGDFAQVVGESGEIEIVGAANIDTSGVGKRLTISLDNYIAVLGSIRAGEGFVADSDGFSALDGDVDIAQGNLNLPETSLIYNQGTITLGGDRFLSSPAIANTFLGQQSGNGNIGDSNTGIGMHALLINTNNDNTAVGAYSMEAAGGQGNIALGLNSLLQAQGDRNISIGVSSGFSYVGGESSNILIGSLGVLGDSNKIRIGTQGAGVGEQNECYIAGIHDAATGATGGVVFVDDVGKLGGANGTNGQVLIGGGTKPAWANITAGAGITLTEGANSLEISSVGGTGGSTDFITDGGTAVITAGHEISILGGVNLLTDAHVANTVTVNLNTTLIDMANIELVSSGTIRTDTTLGDFYHLVAWDTAGLAFVPMATLTAGNPPTMDLNTAVTIGGAHIYRAGDTLPVADGGTGTGTYADGQLLIGKTAGNTLEKGTLFSGDSTISVAYDAGTHRLDIRSVGTGSGAVTFNTDGSDAVVSGAAITIGGSTNIETSGAGATVTVSLKDSIALPATSADGLQGVLSIDSNRFMSARGTNNVFLGQNSGNLATASGYNSGFGAQTLSAVTTGGFNTAAGAASLDDLTEADFNCAYGAFSGTNITTGASNTIIGYNAGLNLSTGSYNTLVGAAAGSSLTGSESHNILIGSLGQASDTGAIRIGSALSTTCYIRGIHDPAGALGDQVVGVGSDGKLSGSNGADGQVLIGGGIGATWANITAGTGIAVTNSANAIQISATGTGSGGTKTTLFTSSGTWTKSPGCQYVTVYGWGGGGGGGSGRRGAIGDASGGSGGGVHSAFRYSAQADFFGSTESVVVGAGGNPGEAQTADNTHGNDGGEGGVTSFGSITCDPGVDGLTTTTKGRGGTNGSIGGGRGAFAQTDSFDRPSWGSTPNNDFLHSWTYPGGTGRLDHGYRPGEGNHAYPDNGVARGNNFLMPTSGGGGGGLNSDGGRGAHILKRRRSGVIQPGDIYVAGGQGGVGAAGGNGADKPTSGGLVCGGAGGGGSGNGGTIGFAGGDGGFPGGGGAGGSAGLNGYNSGAGGKGGDGLVIVVEWLS